MHAVHLTRSSPAPTISSLSPILPGFCYILALEQELRYLLTYLLMLYEIQPTVPARWLYIATQQCHVRPNHENQPRQRKCRRTHSPVPDGTKWLSSTPYILDKTGWVINMPYSWQEFQSVPRQSCPRVTFLGPDPTRRNVDPTRPDPRLPSIGLTRPDPRPDSSLICAYFNWIFIYLLFNCYI